MAGLNTRLQRATRRAFTMLELLISISIATIVVAGLYGLFTMQSRQFLYQDLQMEMHQNLRFAMDILGRSARMAGYGTGGEATGVMGWDGSNYSAADSLPAVITEDAWNGKSDAVTFVYADPNLEMMTNPTVLESCGTDTISFNALRAGYQAKLGAFSSGDLLLCWDYANMSGTRSWMWDITGADTTAGTISVTANTDSDYTASCGTSENLPPVMHCSRAHVVTFYIDDTSDGTGPGSTEHPVLMMDLDLDFYDGVDGDDIPLVDDIEDIQFAYCPSGGTCTDGSASWQNSLTNSEAVEAWMFRYSVVARSSRDDILGFTPSAPMAFENGGGSSVQDGYHRVALTSKVTFRNLRVKYSP